VKSGTRPMVETGLRKRINTTEMAADPPEPNGGYEGSRFNAVRHGVLSELTVLPWEDEAEYAKLLEALVEEYRPRGPTEDHLVEEIAGVIWRKRRLRLAEAGSYWKNVDRATDFSSDSFDERRVVPTLDALLTTPAGTAKDIAKVQNRLTAVSRARDILMAGKPGAYKAAMAELDERTKAHWKEQFAPKLEDSYEDEDEDEDEPVKHYTADAAGLLGFLLCSVLPDCLTQLGSLGIRSLIRAQVLGETLDFQRLEPISRYEVHLDRKFERAVSMLLRLRELRQFKEAG
jgi:hypothetical protein